MMLTNYLQHVGCDPASPDDHSRNFTSKLLNVFVLENGLHTVHHEHPGTHWSRLRSLHDERAERIDPRLNENSILGYVWKAYLHPFRRRTSSPHPRAQAPGRTELRPTLDRASVIGAIVLLVVVLFQLRVTTRVWRSQAFDRPQKMAQSKLIWLLPLIGAALVASVLEEEDERSKGPPAGLGR
jgi:hypothetical protein